MKSIVQIMLPVVIFLFGQQLTAQQISASNVAFISFEDHDYESSPNNLRFMVRLHDTSIKSLEANSSKYTKYFSIYINSYSSIADPECNVYFNSGNANERKMLYKLFKKSSISEIKYKDTYYSTEEFFQKHVL